MNWEAIGAIGEIVGSLAVLLTLIYLSFQIKHARAESRSTFLQHRSDAARQLWAIESTSLELQQALATADQQLNREDPAVQRRLKELTNLSDAQVSMVTAHFSAHFFHRLKCPRLLATGLLGFPHFT